MKFFYVAIRNLLFISLMILSACSTTRRLQEGQLLLIKNKVEIQNPNKSVSANDLDNLIQQKPNKRFLGVIPFSLWFNNISKKWGEEPVVFDESFVSESKDQMIKYLNNIGYYNSKVKDTIYVNSKKVKKALYKVQLAQPYKIRNINYDIPDDSIQKLVDASQPNSLIKQGNIFNSYVLDYERNRLTKVLIDNGYFGFTKSYIYYEADSTLGNHEIDLTFVVKNIEVQGDDPNLPGVQENHKIYHIKNVFIHSDFKRFSGDELAYDTIITTLHRRNDPIPDNYNIIHTPPLKIKPSVITRSMFLEGNKKYNATDAQQSYIKLNELRIYKYVNFNFKLNEKASNQDPKKDYLDCTVQLTRNPVHSYSIEAQGTNTGGDLGIGGFVSYQNKNLFRGGEIFNIRLKGALEAQGGGSAYEQEKNIFWIFNTFEAGIEANLLIPKFLAPISQDLFSRYFRPKTSINLGYNTQDQLEYDRIITNFAFGYEWSESKFKNHILHPVDINLIKVNTTPEFDSILAGESERFRNQYTDHLILGLRYSYIFNNQEINKIKNFNYLRANVETAGNLFNLIMSSAGSEENEDGYREVFGIRYSQFVKGDIDFRYFVMIDRKHTIASRIFLGLAIPYGNSIDIPFEKGYFAGGANGIRAWPLRYLGPGSYNNANPNIERVGDIKIEANWEYRFAIYKIFKGALFYDVGNVWLLSDQETFPGGQFEFNRFLSELAMDVGIGLRFDFNYFIFRIDIAQKLNDPALPEGSRWVPGNLENWFNPLYNLGIGYPF